MDKHCTDVGFGRRVAGESLVANGEVWSTVSREYYSAYREYLRAVGDGSHRGGRDEGAERMGDGIGCVEPPVWVGSGVGVFLASGGISGVGTGTRVGESFCVRGVRDSGPAAVLQGGEHAELSARLCAAEQCVGLSDGLAEVRVGVSGDSEREEVVEKGFGAIELGASCGAGELSQARLTPVRGLHYERNKAKREKEKLRKKEVSSVPEWRRGAGRGGVSSGVGGPSPVSSVGSAPSLAATVATVTTEVAEELEARRTLAARRVVENKVAVKMGELRLASLQDKDKTEALARLELARIQERINTATAKSQASYKKCDSPLDSVGSAGSAGEFAWKQEIRKRDVVEKELDNVKVQLDKMLSIATPEQRRIIAEIPAFIPPTWEELAQEDEDISPYYTMDEMLAEAAKYAHG